MVGRKVCVVAIQYHHPDPLVWPVLLRHLSVLLQPRVLGLVWELLLQDFLIMLQHVHGVQQEQTILYVPALLLHLGLLPHHRHVLQDIIRAF